MADADDFCTTTVKNNERGVIFDSFAPSLERQVKLVLYVETDYTF